MFPDVLSPRLPAECNSGRAVVVRNTRSPSLECGDLSVCPSRIKTRVAFPRIQLQTTGTTMASITTSQEPRTCAQSSPELPPHLVSLWRDTLVRILAQFLAISLNLLRNSSQGAYCSWFVMLNGSKRAPVNPLKSKKSWEPSMLTMCPQIHELEHTLRHILNHSRPCAIPFVASRPTSNCRPSTLVLWQYLLKTSTRHQLGVFRRWRRSHPQLQISTPS